MPRMGPERYRYSKDHLWVHRIGRIGRIGLTDFGQEQLGEVLFVELPDVDDELERSEPFGEIESGRATSELVMPVSGTVVNVNSDLEDNPTLVNEDPYDKGWLVEVELTDPDELDDLMDADAYEVFTEGAEPEDEEEEEDGEGEDDDDR